MFGNLGFRRTRFPHPTAKMVTARRSGKPAPGANAACADAGTRQVRPPSMTVRLRRGAGEAIPTASEATLGCPTN